MTALSAAPAPLAVPGNTVPGNTEPGNPAAAVLRRRAALRERDRSHETEASW
ncbi:hypothetical protein ABZ532_14425 [Streptomyces sp. NPDC019396]|uniref:hypothetical protein n=1 Tax=Streptomyces sp. NPDC019396 TaxID=3154687 RepID=UPI0033F5E42D